MIINFDDYGDFLIEQSESDDYRKDQIRTRITQRSQNTKRCSFL